MSSQRCNRGFTLIEITVTLVVMAVLITVSLQTLGPIANSAKTEEARTELDELAYAIAGNPTLMSNGERSDFGYVGDVGAMPVSLDNLLSNPGSYTTWSGPYVKNDFASWSTDATTDPWNTAYSYTPDSARVASIGSGSLFIRQIAATKSALTINKVIGSVVDQNGTPPGAVYKDSVSVRLTIPNGSGSTTTKTKTTDLGGYFSFDSIPIGRHKLDVVYTAANDSITRYVVVLPASQATTAIRLTSDHWNAGTGSVMILNATFDGGNEGFSYADDQFRSTSQPNYASGAWTASAYSGGGLSVTLGALDANTINSMSGGWSYTFSLSAASTVNVSFRYKNDHTCCYEVDEYSDVLVSIDGTLNGASPNDYVNRLMGDGNDGSSESSGWLLRSFTTGTLGSGSHTIRIGGYNNKKTTANEGTTILIDNVSITR